MSKLNHQDLLTIISALGDLHSDFDPQTLTERTIRATSKMIAAADSVAFTGFRSDGQYADLTWHNGGDYSAEEMEVFAAFVHENPLVGAFFEDHRTETLQITDLTPPEKFERTTLYNEFYRRVGVGNQLVTPMRITDELLITCSINIENKDFSERDKEILTLFAPHLANAIRNAFAYQRLSGALDTEACGIVALNSKGKAVFISKFARQLFEKYFADEKFAENDLPENLNNWLKGANLSGAVE